GGEVAVEAAGVDRHAVQRRRVEAGGERLLEGRRAKRARPRAGDADPDVAGAEIGHEDARHRVARGRVRELAVGGAARDREGDLADELSTLQRRLEEVLE